MPDAPESMPRSGPESGEAKTPASALYLIDGSGFIFRAFHALPPMTRSDGTPVNAVLGFVNMLIRLLTEFGVARIAVVFDAKGDSFRNAFYPEYKANRSAPPDELIPQFGLIREATEAFCLPQVELDGYEADDLIATYTRLAVEQGEEVVIVSSDKDMMQLVGPGVTMFDPIKYKPIGPAEVMEKFGVAPDRVVDVQALAGDSTDNVPGVPGIGVKTAAQLITEFGDLETLLARAGEIKQPKRRESLIQFAEQARVSRRLVLLDAYSPPPLPLDELKVHEPDQEKLIAFLVKQEFRTTLARVQSRLRESGELAERASVDETAPAAPPPPSERYELVTDLAALDRWLALAAATGQLAFDVHTDVEQPVACQVIGIALAVAPGRACYIPLGHGAAAAGAQLGLDESAAPTQPPLGDTLARLKPALADPGILKIGHNAKFDMQALACLGVQVGPVDDTLLLSYVLDGSSQDHALPALAERALGLKARSLVELTGAGRAALSFAELSPEAAMPYAAEQVDLMLRLRNALRQRLIVERQVTLYERIDRPLVPIVARMEQAGIKVDRTILAGLAQRFGERLQSLEGLIFAMAGRPFNIGSPKQLGEVLFGEMKLPAGAKVKTGGWSTHADILEPLAEQGFEIARLVLDWRAISKLKSTYADALVGEIQGNTGRVHTSFALAATNTGRLSSIDPNLQNIPIRTEDGRMIRTAFVAEPGNVLLSVDYSQIELRLVAEIAGIAALKQAFLDNVDVHALTASQVFGVPMEQMTRDIRAKAKAINFGIIYGISGFGLGQQLGVGAREAGDYIKQYLERFHELRVYMDETKSYARAHGYVLTLAGRKCYMPGIGNKIPSVRAAAERQAVNARIQGTAADIIKRAMIRVDRALTHAGSPARMLLSVHDELVFEVPEDEAEPTAKLVTAEMEAAASLGVPLVAEARWGKSWADAH
jgi:DNA polymerase-1